jgi:hypothetical protein
MKLKPTVRIELLHHALKDALLQIDAAFEEHDSLLTITAGHEGDPSDHVHMRTSRHYTQNSPDGTGKAVDCRMRHLNYETMEAIRDEVKRRLGPTFDVVLELVDKIGNPRNHLHVEVH